MKTVRRPPYPKWNPGYFPCSSLTPPLPLSSRRPSVSFGGFGLSTALGQTVSFNFDQTKAIDVGQRARGVKVLTDTGMPMAEALDIMGLT